MTTKTDRIAKTILPRAPRQRVGRALTDTKEFGSWFGMRFEAPLTPGAHMRGTIVPTTVDVEVGKLQKALVSKAAPRVRRRPRRMEPQ
jgi:uncharacterized protein YndB with AHSA1/START domain